jgi:tetratricopeptide (TPR) repeat protein
LAVGWLWYVGMMVPVIGIVQIALYARADRYTYLPQIGVYLLLTWAAADLCAGWRHRRVVLGSVSAIIIVALIFLARTQTSYWRNNESLWTHTLACTSDNFLAQNGLGNALLLMGRDGEAMVHLQQALQIRPRYAEAHYNLGNLLHRMGRDDEAMVHFQQALQLNPRSLKIQNDLAWVLATVSPAALRDGRQAVDLAERANQIAGGEDPIILRTLAAAYAEAGRFDDAVRSAQKAMALARAAGQSGLVEQLDGQLKLYAAKLPFHQESKRFED